MPDHPDRFERENIEFYKKIREGYLLLAESMPERFHIMDGTQDKKLIEDEIWGYVKERFRTVTDTGESRSLQSLRKAVKEGRLAHGILLHGESLETLEQEAFVLAGDLLEPIAEDSSKNIQLTTRTFLKSGQPVKAALF